MTTEMVAMTNLSSIYKQLRDARQLIEVLEIQKMADAFQIWVSAREGGQALAAEARKIILHAECKIGKISKKLPLHRGGNPALGPNPKAKTNVLKKAGITPRRARDAEKLAAIPTAKMDAYIRDTESPSVGGALVELGVRNRYRYPDILAAWRAIALEAVDLLERANVYRSETAMLRMRCGKGTKQEGIL